MWPRHGSFGMTSTFHKKKKKNKNKNRKFKKKQKKKKQNKKFGVKPKEGRARPRAPVLLLFRQRLRQ